MARLPEWPQLDWKLPPKLSPWIENRVYLIGALARRFELAFTSLAEEGIVDLDGVEGELNDWDRVATQILSYTAYGEALPIPAERSFVKELQDIYKDLVKARATVLKAFGEMAEAVAQQEMGSEPDPAPLKVKPFVPTKSFAHFTGETPMTTTAPLMLKKPISAEEIISRTTAESKPLPETRTLSALLGILPSDWVTSVFDHLGLQVENEWDMTVGTRSNALRGIILQTLQTPSVLERTVKSLSEDERGILRLLLSNGGAVAYKRVTEKWALDESDGFYWNARPPSGPLAKLRRKALAFVGTRFGVPTVAVPSDLPLDELLARSSSRGLGD